MSGMFLNCCCGSPVCVGCQCGSGTAAQLDAVYGDGDCGDCSIFDTVVVPKVANFTTLTFGDTCKAATCDPPCLIGGLSAPICYYQSEETLVCGAGNDTTLYFRVSIHQSILNLSLLVVMVSVVLHRPTFFSILGDLQSRTGCDTWSGTCETIDMDIDLAEICEAGSANLACILPDTVHVTIT